MHNSVRYLKMVGPRRAAALQKLGINTVADLLYHFPRRYDDRSRLLPVSAYGQGETATVRGTVLAGQDLKPRRGLTITKLAVNDGMNIFYAVWYNQPYVKKNLPPGAPVLLTGKIEKGFGATQLKVEDYELDDGEDRLLHAGRIVPVYPLTGQLNQRLLRSVVKAALDSIAGRVAELLPASLLENHSLMPRERALFQAHFPDTMEDAGQARRRFIFEELFLFQLLLAARRQGVERQKKPFHYRGGGLLVKRFLKQLPYSLTAAQERVWAEISGDMAEPAPMCRLLQGDVGSGKTVICALALLKAVDGGLQGALMAPTEILAEQHYLNLKKSFADLGVPVCLLTGSTRRQEREELLEQVRAGACPVVVGTHALIQEGVAFKNLALAVIDEQHRFGVRQRAVLQYKGRLPDTLVMTATPIPRTLALTLYGDLDISVIDELPPGRRPVKTYAVSRRQLGRVYRLIEEQVGQGRQAYIVCPLVEESEKMDIQAAVELAASLSEKELENYRVGLLHGRLKADEKEAVMAAFRRREIDVLVSTTVIEVGVDVPGAAVMVILDADRFGLAQLHQLRGRVGRSAHQSYCILVSNPGTEEAKARLLAMTGTGDGFALAEEDLRLRGPGEFCGTRQSGLPDFKIADLLRDWELLHLARAEAQRWVEEDRFLQKPESRLLMPEAEARFGKAENYLGVG
jgi:ATP-dependent DNA helicase RecG